MHHVSIWLLDICIKLIEYVIHYRILANNRITSLSKDVFIGLKSLKYL